MLPLLIAILVFCAIPARAVEDSQEKQYTQKLYNQQ